MCTWRSSVCACMHIFMYVHDHAYIHMMCVYETTYQYLYENACQHVCVCTQSGRRKSAKSSTHMCALACMHCICECGWLSCIPVHNWNVFHCVLNCCGSLNVLIVCYIAARIAYVCTIFLKYIRVSLQLSRNIYDFLYNYLELCTILSTILSNYVRFSLRFSRTMYDSLYDSLETYTIL
jgi:hypothetical protein